MPSFVSAATVLASLTFSAISVTAFSSAATDNLAVYWGQGNGQKPLASFCNDDTIDIIPIGFVNVFPDEAGSNGFPGTNFANACGGAYYTTSGGQTTQLLASCAGIEADIKTCQNNGKKILLSLGGGTATGAYIESDTSAVAFADFLWGAFGPVTDTWSSAGNPRPFGDAVVDGFDFDIESLTADIPTAIDFGYATMANHFRSLFSSCMDPTSYTYTSQTFYLSAAPQCIVPDGHLADAISKAAFDFLFVQFYNTPQCSARSHFDSTYGQSANGGVPTDISYDTWINWVLGNSANKATKVFIGLPASTLAANSADYLTPIEAQELIADFQCKYPANFGGVMLWEATYSDNNQINGQSYAQVIKPLLTGNSCGLPLTSSSTTSSTTSTTSTTTSSTITSTTTSTTSSTTSSTASSSTSSSTSSTTSSITSSTASSTTSPSSSTWTTSYSSSSSSLTSSPTTSVTSSSGSSSGSTPVNGISTSSTSSSVSMTSSSSSSSSSCPWGSACSSSSGSTPVNGVTTSSSTSSSSSPSASSSSCAWGSACSTSSSSTPVDGVTTSSSTSSSSGASSSSTFSTPTGWSTFGTCTSSTCKGLATGSGLQSSTADPKSTSTSTTSSSAFSMTWASWSADPASSTSTSSTLTSTWTITRPTSTSVSISTTSTSVVSVVTMTIVPVPSSVWYASTFSRPSSFPIASLSSASTASALPSASSSSSSSTVKFATGAGVSSWLPASMVSAASPSAIVTSKPSTTTQPLPAITMTTVSVAQGGTYNSDPSMTLSTNKVQATNAAPFAPFTGAAGRQQVVGAKEIWVMMGVMGLVGALVL